MERGQTDWILLSTYRICLHDSCGQVENRSAKLLPFHVTWHDWWIQTLMCIQASLPPWCPRVALELKSCCRLTVMRSTTTFICERPPRDLLLLFQSLSCYASLCTICLSAWVTAEWQVPSENMAHNINARQACGLKGDCSCPSLFLTSSVTAKADVTALSSLKNLLADISSLCHTAERGWLTDWVTEWLTEAEKYVKLQGWLQLDGQVSWRTRSNVIFFISLLYVP